MSESKFLRVSTHVRTELMQIKDDEDFDSVDDALKHVLNVYQNAHRVTLSVGTVVVWSKSA